MGTLGPEALGEVRLHLALEGRPPWPREFNKGALECSCLCSVPTITPLEPVIETDLDGDISVSLPNQVSSRHCR